MGARVVTADEVLGGHAVLDIECLSALRADSGSAGQAGRLPSAMHRLGFARRVGWARSS